MAFKFCPLASGSSGNAAYIGTEHTNLLIDAGVTLKYIEAALAAIHIATKNLDGILITHEHSDHTKGIAALSRKYDIPIYATEGTFFSIGDHLENVQAHNKIVIYPSENIFLNDLCIKPFAIPHDALEPCGFSVFTDKHKASFATDIGHINETVKQHIIDSDILLVEANHDIQMLKTGRYPFYLKKRVLGENGHLSNAACGQLISEILNDRLKHIFLGHLSKDNNVPSLALDTVLQEVRKNCDTLHTKFYVAARSTLSELVEM